MVEEVSCWFSTNLSKMISSKTKGALAKMVLFWLILESTRKIWLYIKVWRFKKFLLLERVFWTFIEENPYDTSLLLKALSSSTVGPYLHEDQQMLI